VCVKNKTFQTIGLLIFSFAIGPPDNKLTKKYRFSSYACDMFVHKRTLIYCCIHVSTIYIYTFTTPENNKNTLLEGIVQKEASLSTWLGGQHITKVINL
jgi:hypothetical protein